jgi:LysR family transcriptional regulator, transcriptional activator of the cysJI operon
MDLRRLEAFCKVYELKSFSKAGQDLYLSQPTISAHIAALEDELGVPLFDRVGRGILSTQAGDILHRHALNIFEAVAQAEAEIQLLMNKVGGDLELGGAPSLPITSCPSFWPNSPGNARMSGSI